MEYNSRMWFLPSYFSAYLAIVGPCYSSLQGLQLSLFARKNWKAWVQLCAHELSPAHGAAGAVAALLRPALCRRFSELPTLPSNCQEAPNPRTQVDEYPLAPAVPIRPWTPGLEDNRDLPQPFHVYLWWNQLGPLKILPAASITGLGISSSWCWEKHQGPPESHGWLLSNRPNSCITQKTYLEAVTCSVHT